MAGQGSDYAGWEVKQCEQCGQPAPEWGKCYDCGKVCCRACKPAGYHLCLKCWNTEDGMEADKDLKESCALEHWADQKRAEMRDGERDNAGRRIKEAR